VPAKAMNGIIVKNTATVFCNKDQVDMYFENTMSAAANVIEITHRPKYNVKNETPAII
jgi:hypothetical protein